MRHFSSGISAAILHLIQPHCYTSRVLSIILAKAVTFPLEKKLGMLGIEPRGAGSGSKYAFHFAIQLDDYHQSSSPSTVTSLVNFNKLPYTVQKIHRLKIFGDLKWQINVRINLAPNNRGIKAFPVFYVVIQFLDFFRSKAFSDFLLVPFFCWKGWETI